MNICQHTVYFRQLTYVLHVVRIYYFTHGEFTKLCFLINDNDGDDDDKATGYTLLPIHTCSATGTHVLSL